MTNPQMINYKDALRSTASSFDGVSDRLLNLASSIALTYLAGSLGWNGDKVPVETIKEQIFDVLSTAGNKKSNAYRFANIGFKLAVTINKGDKTFKESLKVETTNGAVALLTMQVKAMLNATNFPATLDGLVSLMEGPKAEKPVKTLEQRILEMMSKEDAEFTPNGLLAIAKKVNDLLNPVVDTSRMVFGTAEMKEAA